MEQKELDNRFTYHPLKDGQLAKYEKVRDIAKAYAAALDELCPDSREFSLALTRLEEVVFWANAAIARNE
jgi:hypothetical protein